MSLDRKNTNQGMFETPRPPAGGHPPKGGTTYRTCQDCGHGCDVRRICAECPENGVVGEDTNHGNGNDFSIERTGPGESDWSVVKGEKLEDTDHGI